jgi:hypothetical protein
VQMNAHAAALLLVQRGFAVWPGGLAVGGHSYGSFMVGHLLAHTELFAAGIGRSGAFNRTLTPFGFQGEERKLWDAPQVYQVLSPFYHAPAIARGPGRLLLIHGEADENSGTFPLQSERLFNALKGLGAITRLVLLPKEGHGYVARESIMHVLAEQEMWLDKHVADGFQARVAQARPLPAPPAVADAQLVHGPSRQAASPVARKRVVWLLVMAGVTAAAFGASTRARSNL